MCAERHSKGAKFLFNNQTALGTATGYRPVINDFKDHCLSSPDLSYDDLGSKEVISLIMEAAMNKTARRTSKGEAINQQIGEGYEQAC